MTCKDCERYEVCVFYCEQYNISMLNASPEKCHMFKDKSKIVELPLMICDIVYVLTNKDGIDNIRKEIIKCEVSNMRFKQDGKTIVYSCRGRYRSNKYYSGNFVFNSIGKTVFLSQEEAEKSLKERESK